MSHGHIYGPDHLPALKAGDIFLSGHTHIPTADQKDGIYLFNPGSVSLPKADIRGPMLCCMKQDLLFIQVTIRNI